MTTDLSKIIEQCHKTPHIITLTQKELSTISFSIDGRDVEEKVECSYNWDVIFFPAVLPDELVNKTYVNGRYGIRGVIVDGSALDSYNNYTATIKNDNRFRSDSGTWVLVFGEYNRERKAEIKDIKEYTGQIPEQSRRDKLIAAISTATDLMKSKLWHKFGELGEVE